MLNKIAAECLLVLPFISLFTFAMFCKKANIDQHFTYILFVSWPVRICFNIDMLMEYVVQGWDSIRYFAHVF